MESWQLRRAANWVNLSTPLGLLAAHLAGAEISRGRNGTHVASGYPHPWPAASAFTVGSVVVTRHSREWLECRPALLAHEERHAWQYALCGGLPFLPLYAAAAAYSRWRTGDHASANLFERRAGLADGGYTLIRR